MGVQRLLVLNKFLKGVRRYHPHILTKKITRILRGGGLPIPDPESSAWCRHYVVLFKQHGSMKMTTMDLKEYRVMKTSETLAAFSQKGGSVRNKMRARKKNSLPIYMRGGG
jgi:hypothetical protein